MNKISVLDVSLHGRPAGTITHLPGDQTLFAFDEAYIADENRPTLSLSFKDVYGGLLTSFRPVQTRVPPFFSNLLPEGAAEVALPGGRASRGFVSSRFSGFSAGICQVRSW